MSHVAHESGQGISGGSMRPAGVQRRDTGATACRPGRQSWVEWRRAVEGETGGIAVPELAIFVGAKRVQLAVLAKSTVTEPLREVGEEVTRVASMRPQTLGRAQTLARLRALARPAVPWEPSRGDKGEPRLTRVPALGVPDPRVGP
jgi:hypothetical protein